MVVVAVSGCTDNTNSVNSDNTTPPTPAPATPATKPATPAATGPTDILPSSKFLEMPIQEDKISCPACGSFNNVINKAEIFTGKYLYDYQCENCGNVWSESFSTPVRGTPV